MEKCENYSLKWIVLHTKTIHTSHIIDNEKTCSGIEPQFSKILKISKTYLSNHRFFDANCRFFDVSEITETNDSLMFLK